MLDVVERNVLAADFEPLRVEGLGERLNAVRRIVFKDGANRESVVKIDERCRLIVPRGGRRWCLRELRQIFIEALEIGLICLPLRIGDEAAVVDIFRQKFVPYVVIDAGRDGDRLAFESEER